jgi:hypothetical protein
LCAGGILIVARVSLVTDSLKIAINFFACQLKLVTILGREIAARDLVVGTPMSDLGLHRLVLNQGLASPVTAAASEDNSQKMDVITFKK